MTGAFVETVIRYGGPKPDDVVTYGYPASTASGDPLDDDVTGAKVWSSRSD